MSLADHTFCWRDESWACQFDDPNCPRSPGSLAAEIVAEHDEGWVRVHSDEDEGKSEQEMLTGNLVHELIEKVLGAPNQVDQPIANSQWWSTRLEIDTLCYEYAAKIAAEFEAAYVLPIGEPNMHAHDGLGIHRADEHHRP
jgi:hypothetical protein